MRIKITLWLTIWLTSFVVKLSAGNFKSDNSEDVNALILGCDESIRRGEFQRLQFFANSLLEIGIQTKTDSLCLMSYYYLGSYAFTNQDLYKAANYYEKAIFFIDEAQLNHRVYRLLNNISGIYVFLERYKSSLKYITLAEKYIESFDIDENIKTVYRLSLNIKRARVYIGYNDFKRADLIIRNAERLIAGNHDLDLNLQFQDLKVQYFLNDSVNKPDLALASLQLYKQLIEADKKSPFYNIRLSNALIWHIEICLKLKEFDKAEQFLLKYRNSEFANFKHDSLNYLQYKGMILFQKGLVEQSITSFKALYNSTSNEYDIESKIFAARKLKLCYEKTGQYNLAYGFLQDEVRLTKIKEEQDSLNNFQIAVDLANMINQYRIVKQENTLLNNEKNNLLLAVFSSGFILLTVSIIWRVNLKKRKLIDKHNLKDVKEIKTYNLKHSFKIKLISEELDKIKNEIEKIETNTTFTKMELESIKDTLKSVNDVSMQSNLANSKPVGIDAEVLQKIYSMKILKEEDWQEFKQLFIKIHPTTYYLIQSEFSKSLTEGEIRILMLLKLNYNYKNISICLGISKETTRVAIYRIRKKLNIHNVKDLTNLLT